MSIRRHSQIYNKLRKFGLLAVLAAAIYTVPETSALAQSNRNNRNNKGTNLNRNQLNQNNSNSASVSLPETTIEELASPRSLWPLPIEYRQGFMVPDKMTLQKRILASETQPEFADPITLHISQKSGLSVFKQLATKKLTDLLESESEQRLKIEALAEKIGARIKGTKLTLIPSDLAWIDLGKLGEVMKTKTSKAGFSIDQWREAIKDPNLKAGLFEHLQSSLNSVNVLAEKDNGSDNDIVPFSAILPNTVRRLYGKYSHLRGRNCFGTALEFSTPRTILNQTINVELEQRHHVSMINSDEFMRALWLGYYEMNSDEVLMGLKWGDVVVFLDSTPPLSWKSYRHAIVHLGGDIYFHKQSKSAASPIEIVEWKSVVDIWSRITPNLDYKVYRRLPLGAGEKAFQNPVQAIEKLSWTR